MIKMHRSKKNIFSFFHFFTLDIENIYDLIDKELKANSKLLIQQKKQIREYKRHGSEWVECMVDKSRF